jgi:hypothetical protein
LRFLNCHIIGKKKGLEEIGLIKIGLTIFGGIFILATIYLSHPPSIPSQILSHEKIILKGFDGSALNIDSKIPYSPRRTCGACHDYDRITQGYHFQQGRTDGTGKIVISDNFDQKYNWNLSSGMYGKH